MATAACKERMEGGVILGVPRWKRIGFYMGSRQEAYDTELFVMRGMYRGFVAEETSPS